MDTYITVNKEYSLEEYSTKWVTEFEVLRQTLAEVFKDTALQIEHVGSTSIVGMTAKPIIDVLIVIGNVDDVEDKIQEMKERLYLYKKDYIKKNSLFFCKDTEGRRVENIHVFPKGHPHIDELLDTRDYLRSHSEEIFRYTSIKTELAKKYPNDYISYRKEKDYYLNNELTKKVSIWKREQQIKP